MITKAIISSINKSGNRCKVRMPLFENASSATAVEAEALVNIPPGMFNNLFVNDVVFVAFEENALEKPIILGKLFLGTGVETNTPGGVGIFDTLKARKVAAVPCTTLFVYPQQLRNEYKHFKTPKSMADYIKWLEKLTKQLVTQLYTNFKCFKNWTQWQLKPENVEVDDGDIDDRKTIPTPLLYQKEGGICNICGNDCTSKNIRQHKKPSVEKVYPNI